MAWVAHLSGEQSHTTIDHALTALENMEHRGAEGADSTTGDGAGVLLQLPHRLLRETSGLPLPEPGRYGVGVCFLPTDDVRRRRLEQALEGAAAEQGLEVLGWRDVPVDHQHVGKLALARGPRIRQVFLGAGDGPSGEELERRLYVARRVAELANDDLVVCTMSSRTVVYKGMLTAPQLRHFYPDLSDERCASAVALVHSRFSTNTLPDWRLAHPYRLIAHNGEFNTLIGNRNRMRARQASLRSAALGDDLQRVLPVLQEGVSDSATIDNVLELLVRGGRSLPHALMMLVPESFRGRPELAEEVKDFYRYHACLMEPWDGPAAISFTDGRLVGSKLDRNGLRPGRWLTTDDGWVVFASEAGALPVDPARIERSGRLHPGSLVVADLESGDFHADGETQRAVASQQPYGDWFRQHAVRLGDLSAHAGQPASEDGHLAASNGRADADLPASPVPLLPRQLAFGYTQEDLDVIIAPMVDASKEPNGSMGNDTPLAVLSDCSPSLFSYFAQRFAQVTNPAIDPMRERLVMSLATTIGAEANLLDETPEHARTVLADSPVLTRRGLQALLSLERQGTVARTLDGTWPREDGERGLAAALDRLRRQAEEALDDGVALLVVSDRALGPHRVAIPSLLATAAVHHHLVRVGRRLDAALVVESGEAREVHHLACLLGYGAAAVHPYLLLETARDLAATSPRDDVEPEPARADASAPDNAERAIVEALDRGLLKILSKMGISTVRSYVGAQIFEAIGLSGVVVDEFFSGTPSRIGGATLAVLAEEALDRHGRAWPPEGPRRYRNGRRHEPEPGSDLLPPGGLYAWKREGERHLWNPTTVQLLQEAVGERADHGAWQDYARAVDEQAARHRTPRGLLRLREVSEPLPLDAVEPATDIVRRFVTGAMSLGSLSPEAHETLAVAMNRLGGRSNTGEGGEDPARFERDADGSLRRSAIKQVASARFGVTTEYLVNADELQIKVAQGSKPGEGGQLPGHKVAAHIAALRHATPGVELISPPPHHDIYSIEDLKQLIYDLRCANPQATVSVKLVSEVGVGTVAAGVAKANADLVIIAGYDGGTGSSPLSSIRAAGVPWELGVAETQRVLVDNHLRSRVVVQTDGQLKTGRDVVVAAALGAEEFGFSTAPLIATGCIMMRVCHLNTCPVGIATQDPQLRDRYAGTADHVERFFLHLAEDVRHWMARLGVARLDDLVGRLDLLEQAGDVEHWKARSVDLTDLLHPPQAPADAPRRRTRAPEPLIDDALDHRILDDVGTAIEEGAAVERSYDVTPVHRAVGGLLSSTIVRRRGQRHLPADTIRLRLRGYAGQSLGAWLVPGVDLELRGQANDYVGKGMVGGTVVVQPSEDARFRPEDNVIVGNTCLYGATGGRLFVRGQAGERFGVRNSGAHAVVEGVGDHGCEYMTGGVVVVLGRTGRNFAAGMSGGLAYVLDVDGRFQDRVNHDLVTLGPLDDHDGAFVYDLVAEHVARTGSGPGRRLCDDWDGLRPCMIRVLPTDYEQALRQLDDVRSPIQAAAQTQVQHA